MNTNENPHFLGVGTYHLSKNEATNLVRDSLLRDGAKSPLGGWHKSSFTIVRNQKALNLSFDELVLDARICGFVAHIQSKIDREDKYFGGSFGVTVPVFAPGSIDVKYAGFAKVLTHPFYANPTEWDISNDILFYRNESCNKSNEYDFKLCTRYYRAYLSSCISLIDAFINRHILLYKFWETKDDRVDELQKTVRLEDRLELLLKMSTGKDLTAINSGIEWNHFKKLRNLRNEMTHVDAPLLGYSIQDFAEHFNYVRMGIGGLLYLVRKLQHKSSLTFIECLKTAPKAHFNEIIEVNGKNIIKRKK